jgi:hypothetical protein
VGIELGQLIVLAAAFLLLAGIDRAICGLRLPDRAPQPLRLRVIGVSAIVFAIAMRWAVERTPW